MDVMLGTAMSDTTLTPLLLLEPQLPQLPLPRVNAAISITARIRNVVMFFSSLRIAVVLLHGPARFAWGRY